MFTKFPHDFWELVDTPAEGFVLLRILKQVGFNGQGVCFESRESICRACHISVRTYTNVMQSLQEKGIIHVERQHNRPNAITVLHSSARGKIAHRNRYKIFRRANLHHATERGKHDNHTEGNADREPFKVVKRRIEAFQDARNAVPSNRTDVEPDNQ